MSSRPPGDTPVGDVKGVIASRGTGSENAHTGSGFEPRLKPDSHSPSGTPIRRCYIRRPATQDLFGLGGFPSEASVTLRLHVRAGHAWAGPTALNPARVQAATLRRPATRSVPRVMIMTRRISVLPALVASLLAIGTSTEDASLAAET